MAVGINGLDFVVVLFICIIGLVVVLFPLICVIVACFAAERTKNEAIKTNHYLEQIVKNQNELKKMLNQEKNS